MGPPPREMIKKNEDESNYGRASSKKCLAACWMEVLVLLDDADVCGGFLHNVVCFIFIRREVNLIMNGFCAATVITCCGS